MSRYSRPSLAAPEPTFEGDTQFVRLNMIDEPDELQPGDFSAGENIRCPRRGATKRRGSRVPAGMRAIDFPEIIGAEIYRNPFRSEAMIIVCPEKVYQIPAGGATPVEIPLPDDTTLEGPIYPVQAIEKLLLGRGTEETPLIWDGQATTGFKVLEQSTPENSARAIIPNFSRAMTLRGRLLIPVDRTNVALADYQDPTQHDPILQNFPVNHGDTSDPITRLFGYAQATMLIGRTHRIEVLSNFSDPLHPEETTLEDVNTQLGSVGWDSWLMVGADAMFLSPDGGIFRILQSDERRMESAAVPVSDLITPLINRINWPYAHLSQAALTGRYAKFAVPLDGSTVPNAVLNYNTVSQGWESVDFFDPGLGMQIDRLLSFPYRGMRRAFAVNYRTRSIHLLDEGDFDVSKTGVRYEIRQLLRSRGYATLGENAATLRDFKRLEVSVRTRRPSLEVAAITERNGDRRELTADGPITKDPEVSAVWDSTDPEDREDFTVVLGDGTDAELNWDAPGIDPDRRQGETLRFALKSRSRFSQLELTNSEGECDVTGILLESTGQHRTYRRAA